MTDATAMWGYTHSVAALGVACIAPFAGMAVDRHGRSKLWIALMTMLGALASAALWWAVPGTDIVWVLTVVVLAVIGIELAGVFYNAQLFFLSRSSNIGKISGMSWGFGYGGGIACLVLALMVFVDPNRGLFDSSPMAGVRATGPLTAMWLIIFTLPLLLWVPDRPGTAQPNPERPDPERPDPERPITVQKEDVSKAITPWHRSWRQLLNREPRIIRFLCARLLYADALVTLFAFGGIYATGTFGFSMRDVLLLAIGLNLGAGIGAVAFSFLDDALGTALLIRLCLSMMISLGLALLIAPTPLIFCVLALAISLFIGPLQAASRSLMAQLSPADTQGCGFGLFAMVGKMTAFIGPILVAILTETFESQRVGMAVIVVLLTAGWILMCPVEDRRANGESDASL